MAEDKLYSKNGNGELKGTEKSIDPISRSLKRYGPHKVKRFQSWVDIFKA